MNFLRSLFTKRKEKTFYHEALAPEERIYLTIKDHIFPKLEPSGFKLTRNPLQVSRTKGQFVHSIHFQKNKWNRRGEMASFCPYITVRLAGFAKWHLKTYGEKAEDDDGVVTGMELRAVPGCSSSLNEGFYDLAVWDNDELMTLLTENLLNCALPYMDRYVEPGAVLELLQARPAQEPLVLKDIVDLSLITGDLEQARQALKRFEDSASDSRWLKRKMAYRKAFLEKQ